DDDQDDEHYSPPVRSYEEFMTMIDECQSPASLQRIHEDILAQIRKRRILIMGQNKDDIVHGHRVRDVLVYINRLYVAKKKAERRLEMLVRDQALLSDSNNRGGGGYLARGPRGSVSSLPEQQQHIRPIANASTVLSARTFSAGSDTAPTAHIPSRLLSKKQQQQAAVPRRQPLLKPSPMSRTSTYYQHRDDPAKLGPPQFTQREILTNVSSLSAFAEYMDVIGHKFILEFWLNVEGVRQSSSNNSDNNSGGLSGRPSRAIFPSIVRTLWKSYFTLRVDELASLSVRGYEVEAAISRVQRLLKPYRVVSAETVDLDVARLDDSVCVEAFELICLVQNAVFRHMETSILPPFVRSAFYSQFLKEYYVTPRQDLIEAALFEPVIINVPVLEEDEEDEGSRVLGTEVSNNNAAAAVTGEDDEGARVLRRRHRRVSVTSSNSGSAPRKGSLSRRWNFSARTRHHHDEPVVGTSTRAVLASELSGSRTSISGMA
ncbi:tRNA (guanine-N(7)-)-methyltransferase (tRNA(m7G46)-methyltransferase), partial [Coemansia sp. RSA 2618]